MKNVFDWQARFWKQPIVYYTYDLRNREITGNFYQTKGAAQVDVDYATKHGDRLTIHSAPMHNLELSRERWER